jgi:hypothetical protein
MLAGKDAIEKDAKSEGCEILGRKRRTASPTVDIIVLFSSSMFRIGALDPWVEHLLEVLLQHYRSPLPPVDHHPVYASATPDPLSDTIWESFLCFIRLQLRQKLTRPSS